MNNKKTTRKQSMIEWRKFPVQKHPKDIHAHFLSLPKQATLVRKTTPISSMGSCFAGYISQYLINKKYNYLLTEHPIREDVFSAHWGSVLNPPQARQIFQYSLENNFTPKIPHWEYQKDILQDPYRAGYVWHKDNYNKKIKDHREASKTALTQSKVFIFTLGLIEVWRDKRDKATFARVPPLHLYDPKIHEFHILSVKECITDLQTMVDILHKHNPKCSIIFTVSPIPLQATFRDGIDVISASHYSKSVLRAAAEQVTTHNKHVYYFPSFEFVLYAYWNKGGPWIPGDIRHVRPNVIKTMMTFFLSQFGGEG